MNDAVLRIAGIAGESIVDGPGFRMTVFAQGCTRKCAGCHNPKTHDINGGYFISCGDVIEKAKKNPLLRGLTFSGGEPFLQAAAFSSLARMARGAGLSDIVTFTGFTFEEIYGHNLNSPDGYRDLLSQTDILIDGPYIESLRTLSLQYRGSSNQRVIDIVKTLNNYKEGLPAVSRY